MADPLWDLIDTTFLTPYLPATLTAAETANLPALITGASKAVARWSRRLFVQAAYDETRTPQQSPDPFTNSPPTVQLGQFPVRSIQAVQGGRVQAVSVVNAGSSQRATVQLATSGDPEIGLTPTGITLTTVASGVPTTNTLPFSGSVTVSALAAAIVATGNGWAATVAPGYASRASADLVTSIIPRGCLSGQANPGASLDLFAADLDLADVDVESGVVLLDPSASGWAPGLWPGATPADSSFGAWARPVRIRYTAGFPTIPEQVQHATAITVQAYYLDAVTVSAFRSVKQGNVAYEMAEPDADLPPAARSILAKFRRYEA